MNHLYVFTLVVFITLLQLRTTAQTQFSAWIASFNTIKIPGPFSFHLDVQVRSTHQIEDLSTFIFRPGLNWHVRKNMIATAGYGYVVNRTAMASLSGYHPEHRIWEQFILNHHINAVGFTHRFRLEQRFIPKVEVHDNDLIAEKHLFAHRFRYFMRSIIPLNSKKGFEKGMFGAVQNELFLNLGNKDVVNGKTFDQNRFYVAAGYRFSKKIDLEAGYLNQYVIGRNSAVRNNHVAQVASYVRL